jgi:hypothetical protein
MGCWTIYCLLCGGPTINEKILTDHDKYLMLKKYEEDYANVRQRREKDRIANEGNALLEKYAKKKREYEWLNNCVILCNDGKNYWGIEWGVCEQFYRKNNFDREINTFDRKTHLPNNYVMHKHCHILLESTTGKKIHHDDIPGEYIVKNNFTNQFSGVDYGKIKDYQHAEFNATRCFYQDRWLLESPLSKNQNQQRVLGIIAEVFGESLSPNTDVHVQVKRGKLRKGPSESATLFPEGTKKLGNDGAMWIIIVANNGVKRWKRLGVGMNAGRAQYHGHKSDVMVPVPTIVKKWAKVAFDLKKHGFVGAKETGWKRAKQLATQKKIPIEDLRYMRNWFARHIVTSYPGFREWYKQKMPLDKKWHSHRAIISWMTWAGNAGFNWVNDRKTLKLLNWHFGTKYHQITK